MRGEKRERKTGEIGNERRRERKKNRRERKRAGFAGDGDSTSVRAKIVSITTLSKMPLSVM
jgi:hypothetical protein